jgi:hypothetical protein
MSSVKNLGHTGERQGSRKCKWLRRNKKGIFMVGVGGILMTLPFQNLSKFLLKQNICKKWKELNKVWTYFVDTRNPSLNYLFSVRKY